MILPHGLDLFIVNYRTPVDLDHCLASLDQYRPTVPWRLAVVNVDGQERDAAVRTQWQTRMRAHMSFVDYPENVGYGTAVNGAVWNHCYDTLGIFNADVQFTDGVLDQCFEALHSHDEWAVLGPRQIDDQGRITHGGLWKNIDRGFHQPDSPAFTDIRDDVTTVSGSAYFIKRAVWDELAACPDSQWVQAEGAFLPTRHYWEETWCSYHARAHGYKCVYYGPAVMIHLWHRASPRGSVERHIADSRLFFEQACFAHNIEL